MNERSLVIGTDELDAGLVRMSLPHAQLHANLPAEAVALASSTRERDLWTPGPVRGLLARAVSPTLAKWLFWEFWPTWAAYAPMVPWFVMCAVRERGLTLPLIANAPGPLSLLAGESKSEILNQIPEGWKPATALILAGSTAAREHAFAQLLAHDKRFALPLICKPDRGYRGQGLRLARTLEEAHAALALHAGATIVQAFDPGPCECGILYAREPGSRRGRILGITGKVFPSVLGDGAASLVQLVLAHPRLRLQRDVFLRRLGPRATQVPAAGERVPLAVSGNHCQGTMFVDASHLATEALRERCDWLAHHVPGLHYGRFDIRYTSDDLLARGEAFRIVELYGLASEPTHAYYPSLSLRASYAHLARAIRELYRLGALRRAAGARAPGFFAALRALREAGAVETSDALAD
jgi:hypothetical protein